MSALTVAGIVAAIGAVGTIAVATIPVVTTVVNLAWKSLPKDLRDSIKEFNKETKDMLFAGLKQIRDKLFTNSKQICDEALDSSKTESISLIKEIFALPGKFFNLFKPKSAKRKLRIGTDEISKKLRIKFDEILEPQSKPLLLSIKGRDSVEEDNKESKTTMKRKRNSSIRNTISM